MAFAPEIVIFQAFFKAIFVLAVVLAWAAHRRVLAMALLVLSMLPAIFIMATPFPGGSLIGGSLLWMGEFPLFALALCLALPLGFSASLWSLLPGVIAGVSLNLWKPFAAGLVNLQMQFLRQMPLAGRESEAAALPSAADLWQSIGLQAGLSAASGFLAATFALLWIGRRNGMGRISLRRSIGPLARLQFPQWPVWALALGLLLLVLRNSAGQNWASCLVLFSGAFYLVRGMAVWSTATTGKLRGNFIWFLALTGTILFFPEFFLVATIAIGLLDQWFLFRERLNSSIGENP